MSFISLTPDLKFTFARLPIPTELPFMDFVTSLICLY